MKGFLLFLVFVSSTSSSWACALPASRVTEVLLSENGEDKSLVSYRIGDRAAHLLTFINDCPSSGCENVIYLVTGACAHAIWRGFGDVSVSEDGFRLFLPARGRDPFETGPRSPQQANRRYRFDPASSRYVLERP